MRHFLYVGYYYNETAGFLFEVFQYINDSDSAFDAMDFFSNHEGNKWYEDYYLNEYYNEDIFLDPENYDPLHDSLEKYFKDRENGSICD